MKGGLVMQVMGKASLSFYVRILTDAIIAANIGALIFLPPILKYTYSLLSTSYLILENYTFLLVFLYICGVLTLGILVLGHFILRNIEKEQPFSGKNAMYFKLLGINFLLLSAIFFVKIFMYNTIL